MRTMNIQLDMLTATVLDTVAENYKMDVEHLVEQILYRDAATMSGWPGELGTRLRRAIRDLTHPDTDTINGGPF